MKIIRWFLVVILFLLMGAGFNHTVSAQSSDSVYVAETGHWIWGDFLRTYNSVSDPLLFFGYPITDDFTDPVTNQRVQYFQRARFDLVDTAQGPQIQIAPLGQLMHEVGAPLANIPREGPTCRSFSTGYSVCYAFLQFYDGYAGATRFGNPISEVEVIDGHYVQYFDFARMEWWPDKPSGQRVVLTDLGRMYFDKNVANPELLQPSPSANIAGKLINPVVRVFILRSLIGPNEQQTVYVIAQDQYFQPLQNTQVGVTLYFPDETKEFYRLAETNEFGISQLTFTTGNLPVRTVVNIEAEINIRGEFATGKTWFRIWW
ncbi:MAG: hypothetical protein NTZ74_15255 [Chloroflexi bacterium]|nr:hypothetical protein [Chloroflexota bacterium]